MIEKPTVIILGAGASMPYGFPSGKKLVEQIYITSQGNIGYNWKDLEPAPIIGKETINGIFNQFFNRKDVEEFGKALYLSNQSSIDAFLEHRTEFTQIGKLAIAVFILGNEQESNLFNFKNREKGFYQYLFNKMNTNWEEFGKNRVSFITFNYDRSLEYFLLTSLQNTYNKSEIECLEQLSKIPIIHVHGSLGNLVLEGSNGVPYGGLMDDWDENSELATRNLFESSKQIKIITEDQTNSTEFQKARDLLQKAENIYFLGFGYHPINMERLEIQKLPFYSINYAYEKGKILNSPVMGTGYGMEDSEIYSVQTKWKIGIPDNACDSLLFLRKYAKLD